MIPDSLRTYLHRVEKIYRYYIAKKGIIPLVCEILRNSPKIFQHLICKSLKWLKRVVPTLSFYLNFVLCFLVDVFRLGNGSIASADPTKAKKAKQPLHLYEFEGCPFCRKVRETLSILAIDFVDYPCPKETIARQGFCDKSRFRPHVKNASGVLMFPYLEDPNTGVKMHESDEIVDYLWREYGDEAKKPWNLRFLEDHLKIQRMSYILASFCRPLMECGILRIESHAPKQPLELWGYEGNFRVRRVREILCSLELPYLMHTTPPLSGKSCDKVERFYRDALAKPGNKIYYAIRFGIRKILQYLGIGATLAFFDPNTNTFSTSSSEIVSYLQRSYQNGEAPEENWLQYTKPETKTSDGSCSTTSTQSLDD